MKKILCIALLAVSSLTFGQQSNFWENVRFGGGFGFAFGKTTTISISPTGIYDFRNGFSLGAGLNYTRSENGSSVTTNKYGGSVLALYNVPVVNVELSGELEQSFGTQDYYNTKSNFSNTSLFVGLSWRWRGLAYGFRYDLLHDKGKSIYSSPISPIIRYFF